MSGAGQLREAREARGWTQEQAAKRLRVTQAYLSMLESGRRAVPARMAVGLARLFDLPATALPLPSHAGERTEVQLAEDLAVLGYPGFRHLVPRPGTVAAVRRNPAEVLVAALRRPNLDSRTVEALPWLALEFANLDLGWLLREAKLADLQNRLGYVVCVARELAARAGRTGDAGRLRSFEHTLEQSRLAREDTLCHEALSGAERRWLKQRRTPEARHWRLLTDLSAEQIQNAS
ncbi:MAG TPA: helix-turn-helix transcriptional regulator [Terriglobales bacterium]|nr:helix-turn-helix transcriptional regulator [Terriglobales bacterium]